MKLLALLASLAGLGLAVALVGNAGFGDVARAVGEAGWGVALVVLVRVLAVLSAGAAWRLLFPPSERPAPRVCLSLRVVREGVNNLLPVAQVGGEVLGARLLTFFRVPPPLAAAGTVADVMVQVGTQFVFTVAGLAALRELKGDNDLARYVTGGLLVAAPLLTAFAIAQKRGAGKLLGGLLARFSGSGNWGEGSWGPRGAVAETYARLASIYAAWPGLAGGILLHLGVWVLGTAEVWIALRCMGYPVGLAEAFAIESLGQAVKGAGFAVPGAIGVQEGGLVALCALFGVPADTALALSLVKRVADLAVGVPGLLIWQGIEGRRALRARAASRAEAAVAPPGG